MGRTNLRVFRVRHLLSQSEMAEKIPCARATYQTIESGKRDGRQTFWHDLQKAFNIPDSEMYELMKIDEK